MDKREYKTITIDGIEYVIPSFIDGRAGIITPLGKDETGNLKFNYLGHEFKALKLNKTSIWTTTIWGIPYWLWLPLSSITFFLIFVAVIYLVYLIF
ncbi:hypothetical protein [Rodentibacter caecimuris]|uniref:hypothetical protein n=1 Tax=Rodentibacter caecimuris TaxID=1796644 RepID=UPI002119D185|nr:hypothetical protein [Rodentibacter heylii]MCQ9124722.1 hypothetical protein [Rodentibacter heylii]